MNTLDKQDTKTTKQNLEVASDSIEELEITMSGDETKKPIIEELKSIRGIINDEINFLDNHA